MTSITRTAAVLVVVAGLALAGCSAPHKNSSTTGPAAPQRATGGGAAGGGAGGAAAPAAPGTPLLYDGTAPPSDDRQAFGTEIDPATTPESTFAMDVDTASYGYARNLIRQGQRPVPQAVRPEEFVNAFREDYAQPAANGFTVALDGAQLPGTHRMRGGADVRLLRVGLQTRAEDPAERPAAALTFVIDVSGSMGEPGKLDMVKEALHTLVGQLRPTDSVAIVTFTDEARVVRPMTRVQHRAELNAAIDGLAAGGSTNLESGLVTGYKVARDGFRNGVTNRVVLLSDGLANVGDTAAAPILAQVREEADKQIALLGVGVGTDYGDQLMEQLADHGDGFVVYVSEPAQARKVFVEQLPATLAVRARDAKVQVRFDARTVAGYRLIGYDDRALPNSAFRNDHVDGGEVGPGHSVTALYAVRLRAGTDGGQVADARIRWQDPASREAQEAGATITVAELSRPFSGAAPRLQMCYAAAYFAEVLRRSPYGGEVGLGDLAAVAAQAAQRTGDPDVADLADVIRRAGD